VSHHAQPTVQPWSRTKAEGVPTDGPSPWIDAKTSLTRMLGGIAISVRVTGARLISTPLRARTQRARTRARPTPSGSRLAMGLEHRPHLASVDRGR
jgi:hypothetical protein